MKRYEDMETDAERRAFACGEVAQHLAEARFRIWNLETTLLLLDNDPALARIIMTREVSFIKDFIRASESDAAESRLKDRQNEDLEAHREQDKWEEGNL